MQISNKYVAIELGGFCTLANKVEWGGINLQTFQTDRI